MDRIDLIKAYLAVADTGSFTAAANRLGITPQLTSKYVKALEDHLGAQLFNRSTRRVSLTQTGRSFQEKFSRLIEEFEELTAEIRQDEQEPRGVLRVTAPTNFGELFFVKMMSDFADKHPNISIDLNFTDRYVNMLEERVDIAIRLGALEDSSLIARRIGTAPIKACASPAYLESRSRPSTPHDLLHHSCIVDTNFKAHDNWPFMIGGEKVTVSPSGRFRVNSASAALSLALAGQGVALLPVYIVSRDLKSGRLVTLLNEYSPKDLTIYAVYPSARHISVKVRSFLNFISAQFKVLDNL